MKLTRILGTPQQTFAAGGASLVSSGTTGATEISVGYLWHPSTVVKPFRILEMCIAWSGGAGGDPIRLRLARITAENGTPPSSETIKKPNSGRTKTSEAKFVVGGTAPTRQGGFADVVSLSAATPGSYIYNLAANFEGDPFELAPSVAEGWEWSILTGTSGPTTAAQFSASMKWLEL